MPKSDRRFPNIHHRTRLGGRRHGFVSTRISQSNTHVMKPEGIPFLSHRTRSAERRAYRDIEHEHYPVNTFRVYRDKEHPACVRLTLTRTHASRARPQPSEEHWVIVFGVRRHPVQVGDQCRP